MRRTPGSRTGLSALALGLSLATLAVLGTPGTAEAAPGPRPHAKHAHRHDALAREKAPTVVLTPGTTYAASTGTQAQEIDIPVADGLTPSRVTGKLVFDNDATGTVQVLAHGQVVATVRKEADTASAPVTIPVGAQDLTDGRLVLSLRYLADALSDPSLSCLRSNDGTVELTDVTIDATGTAQPPTTLATFFGQGVTAVSIVAPAADSAPLQAAALAFAWATQTFHIATDTLRGHRDLAQTSCPGANLYAHLSSGDLKGRINELLAAGPVDLQPVCGPGAAAKVAAIEAG